MTIKQNNTKMKKNKKRILIPLIIGIIVCLNIVLTLGLEPYYNLTAYGPGFEGILNYDNIMVGGYFVIAFLAFIWIVAFAGLEKAGYNDPSSAAFAFLLTLLGSFFFALFTTVSNYAIFASALGLGGSIFWAIIKGRE